MYRVVPKLFEPSDCRETCHATIRSCGEISYGLAQYCDEWYRVAIVSTEGVRAHHDAVLN